MNIQYMWFRKNAGSMNEIPNIKQIYERNVNWQKGKGRPRKLWMYRVDQILRKREEKSLMRQCMKQVNGGSEDGLQI